MLCRRTVSVRVGIQKRSDSEVYFKTCKWREKSLAGWIIWIAFFSLDLLILHFLFGYWRLWSGLHIGRVLLGFDYIKFSMNWKEFLFFRQIKMKIHLSLFHILLRVLAADRKNYEIIIKGYGQGIVKWQHTHSTFCLIVVIWYCY